MIGSLAFVTPWLLAGLLALPVLWWLLRAIPPSPRTEAFAPVRLLLGLDDPEREAERTPLWLLLLRMAAVAAVILGFAQPILNPSERLTEGGTGPVLVVMDQGWASAPDWEARRETARAAIKEAGSDGRPVMLWLGATAADQAPRPGTAEAARATLDGLSPAPVPPDHATLLATLREGGLTPPGEVVWLSDGLSHGPATGELADALSDLAPMRLVLPQETARGLTPPRLEAGRLAIDAIRAEGGAETLRVVAMAGGEERAERPIAVADADFSPGDEAATATFDLPLELVAEVTRLVLSDGASPGGAALADAAIRRVPVAVVDPASEGEVPMLTSARHYLTEALTPHADVFEATLEEAIAREPAAIFLADHGAFDGTEREGLEAWLEEGGLLVRFAGPRLAAAVSEAALGASAAMTGEDALLPVRLRRGGRSLGGALAWGDPRRLGPFDAQGPFRRLEAPDEVEVKTQVLAEPSPDLAGKVWATLDDGTPLVTAAERGEGRVVLFHVSADAEWSSLPLSGLFVEMLGRLIAVAPGQAGGAPEAEDLADTLWRLDEVVSAEGALLPASQSRDPVAGERLVEGRAGQGLPPGIYVRADNSPRAAGAAEALVLNLHGPGDRLAPLPDAPAGVVVERIAGEPPLALAAPLILLAVLLAAIDTAATLWISGRLPAFGRLRVAAAALVVAGAFAPAPSQAQESPERRTEAEALADVSTAAETTLGYVLTGDAEIDRVSRRAMVGLGNQLTRRTAVEPGPPVGVDPETDELALLPVLYLPLTGRTLPGEEALARLERYIANGGMVLIDTQSGPSGAGGATPAEMRQVARALNLPPLAPVDGDHVLTRTFYLLNSFPGRWRGGRVWAEAPPEGGAGSGGDPDLPRFDRVDDNVSPVVVGSADWAAAWAVDETGRPMFPVGRSGDRQREMAIRFGVNLVLYALTGNYKSDQVHAPAVLERLGQ